MKLHKNVNLSTHNMRSSFCNNCGLSGHLFQSCKSPITSIGIIAFRRAPNGEIQYLLICRKDSLGYIDFIRGKYPINDKRYLRNIFSEMTVEEKYNLKPKALMICGMGCGVKKSVFSIAAKKSRSGQI